MNKEDIPMLSTFVHGDLSEIEDKAYYVCYPTELHKEKDSRWYFPGTEIKAWKKISDDWKKIEMELMWGKK